jgi:hypothetical protein
MAMPVIYVSRVESPSFVETYPKNFPCSVWSWIGSTVGAAFSRPSLFCIATSDEILCVSTASPIIEAWRDGPKAASVHAQARARRELASRCKIDNTRGAQPILSWERSGEQVQITLKLYQVSDNLTHVGDSRIGVGLIQHGKQLSEVCHGRPYPASP